MANNMQYLRCIVEADVCGNNDDDVQRHFLLTQFVCKYISEGAADVTVHSAVNNTLVEIFGLCKIRPHMARTKNSL